MGLPSSFTQLYGTILVHCELLSCLCSTPFFLVSTEMAGSPAAWNRRLHVGIDVLELGVAVGVVGAFARLAIGLATILRNRGKTRAGVEKLLAPTRVGSI